MAGSAEERIRLFVALELPDPVLNALIDWRSPVLAGVGGLRPLAPESLHLTLCFLGWQPGHAVDGVTAVCREVSGRLARSRAGGIPDRPGFELALDEAVWLPPRRPRVLAVRLLDHEQRLAQLQADLSERLEAGGWYVPERRAYLPHVTVARAGGRARVPPAPLPALPALRFTASRVTLFRSRLSPAGARYEALARVELR